MKRVLACMIAAGCWTSSPSTPPTARPPVASSTGGATYGGATYGGTGYGGMGYGGLTSLTGTSVGLLGEPDDGFGGLIGNTAGDGVGLGGGSGAGWGTIGTGTIGHGSGTGTGHGSGPLSRTGPHVSSSQPAVTGDLDKEIIRRFIRQNLRRIVPCYERELIADPSLQGKLTVKFRIDRDGHVGAATGSGLHPRVDACVASVIKSIEFPKPRGGGVVNVTYPFLFKPAP